MKDDLKYVEILCLGHEAGLQYFIAQFGEPLHFFAYKITKNREVSEEIVSESFCKLWQRKEKMETYEMVRSFLFSVTRNACYDHMGSAYQKKISLSHNDWTSIEGKEGDMLGQIIYIELIKQIIQELEKLPKKQAEIFRLSYIEGLDTEEICRVLNTTANNVYFAKSKVLNVLRQNLSKKDMGLYLTLIAWMLPLD
ncbi:RNA polymerase sigma factor [Sphingobacterium paucimobilis]|uniref:RNA polymerase sigma factor 70 region 4 type 2 domain-containing protein n=1 Tax=Sphingobacterium paucimobilis HER1398 TaxID=1346330 RepID=U2JE02_9SPHI|nr:sigma-70 family RNA polymerase sigma factor [Sphingobacterium paucimobilis]ERJ60908.1 hypothetical protein M472_19315 [Sphingobacterium paucimobilis HER1398]